MDLLAVKVAVDQSGMEITLYAILGTALAIWIVSVWLTSLSFRNTRVRRAPGDERFGFEAPPVQPRGVESSRSLEGSLEVPGASSQLCDRFVKCLVHSNPSQLIRGPGMGLVRILDRTGDVVRFESNHSGRVGVFDVTVQFQDQESGQTRIDYEIRTASGTWMLYAAVVAEGLGLVAIVTAWWLISTYVLNNPRPDIRWQTIQAVQVAHFLWPPFLFLGLQRHRRRYGQSVLEAILTNLPYIP